MHILVTGVSGFVGHYLLDLLLKNKNTVSGIGYTTPDSILHYIKDLRLFKTDLCDMEGLKNDIRESAPDLIFHLGGVASVKRFTADIKKSFEINTIGSLNLFEAARTSAPKSTVVFISSAEVYGNVSKRDIPIRETLPMNPCDFYGVSKASAEFLALNYWKNYGMKIVILRPFNHIGPGQATDFVTANFAQQIAQIKKGKKEPVIEVGNLKVKRDFTDVRDIVRAYYLAGKKCSGGEVYNICSGRLFEIGDILDRMIDIAGVRIKVRPAKDRIRKVDIACMCGDGGKFRKKTGWEPQINLDETLKDLLNYWMEKT